MVLLHATLLTGMVLCGSEDVFHATVVPVGPENPEGMPRNSETESR